MLPGEWSATRSSDLDDALYRFLEHTSPQEDKETMPRVSVQLCDLIYGTLSDIQRAAVDVARAEADGKGPFEYARFLAIFADAIDADMRSGYADKLESAKNRLVWCALNKNTILSTEASDFVVMQAEWVGLGMADICKVFCQSVPGFAAWLNEYG